MKKFLFLVPLIALTIISCGITRDIEKPVNTGVDTLNEAIRKLETNSNRWENVLEESRDKLIQEGKSTLANEVSNILSSTVSDTGIEAKCYTDYLRDRTKEDLIKLRATITGEQLQLKPVFCNPTPDSINMNLPPNERPIIEIAGYNLTKDAIQVFLVDEQNQSIDVSNSLDNPTDYKLTVTLNKIPLNDSSERLIFKLPNGKEQTISIIKAYKPPKEEFRSSRIHITGTISMNDDEYFGDENKNITVDTYVDVPSDANQPYHWEDCVGDEVQGYVDVQLQLDKETGRVSGQGSGRYYEGTSCGETDLQGSDSFDFQIPPGDSYVFQRNLSDSDGGVSYNLNFKNENVDKVMVPQ